MLFLGTALKVHRILQLTLHGCNKGCFIRSHGVGAMLLSNVMENTFQVICNQASEILVLPNLRDLQRPQVQIVCIAAVLHQCHLTNGFQHDVHVVDPHIRNPVNVNLRIQHKPLEIFSDEYGWSRSVPNLSGKLKRGSLRYGEAVELADALGYDIVWQRRKNKMFYLYDYLNFE